MNSLLYARGGSSTLTPRQFALVRAILGAALVVHFLYLVPYGAEVFGADGMLPSIDLNSTAGWFPNLFALCDAPWFVRTVLVALAGGGAWLAAGWRGDRVVAAILWYGWASLFHRNNFISTPAVPYVGWLLLAYAVLGNARALWVGAWVLLGLGYLLSGIDKLTTSPSWRSGEALTLILTSPIARTNPLPAVLVGLPAIARRTLTWGALGVELSFAPLALFKVSRRWAWWMAVALHLGILTTLDLTELTCTMILLHLFTFDPSWLPPRVVDRDDFSAGCHRRRGRFTATPVPLGSQPRLVPQPRDVHHHAQGRGE
jgi:hypothetical protein